MTGKELIELLSSYPDDILNRSIEISTIGDAIGPAYSNPVKTVAPGFDWDSGRLFLVASEPVISIKSLGKDKRNYYKPFAERFVESMKEK